MDNKIIKTICQKCITEGEALLKTKWSNDRMGSFTIDNPETYVDLEGFFKWKNNSKVLINLLGDLSKPWNSLLNEDDANTLANTYSILGTLKSMIETINNGYLLRFEDIIFAETFSNLIDQSEYLFKQGYILAAGVLGRAVLEEKLRNLCNSHNVLLTKKQTTISGYNMELYKSKIYDKIEFKNIDLLASIGNNAAHNKPITKEEVKKLLTGVLLLLNKYK